MGRKRNPYKPERLPLTLIEPTRKRLERLVKTGGYGNNPTDAARIIIMQHLRELDAQNKITLFVDEDDEHGDGTKK